MSYFQDAPMIHLVLRWKHVLELIEWLSWLLLGAAATHATLVSIAAAASSF